MTQPGAESATANIAPRGTPTQGVAASGAAFTVSVPAGTTTGDLLILVVGNAGQAAPATPAGWQALTISAGTGHDMTVFTATYTAALTRTFTNAASAAAWVCQPYYYPNGNFQVVLDGAPAIAINSTNNTTVPTGTASATGNVAGDWYVTAYVWTSAATLNADPLQIIDVTQANGSAISAAIGYYALSPLGANASTPALAPTLSAANSRKAGASILLMAVPQSTSGYPPLSLSDAFNTGTLNTSKWTGYGTGQSMTASALQVAPPGTSGVYGGIFANTTVDLRGHSAYVRFTQRLNNTAGTLQTFQMQLDGSNLLEFGHIDGNLVARYTAAGASSTIRTAAWPSALLYLRYVEDQGNVYFQYSTDPKAQFWTEYARAPISFSLAAVTPILVAGTYSAVATPGTALYGYFNTAPTRDIPAVASVGQSLGGNYARLVTADAPIGWWRLGETSGTSATDASGRSHNGTYAATGVTLNQASSLAGDANPSARFAGTSGVSGSVSIAAHADWRPVGGGWTMEAWVNPTALSGTQEVIRIGGGDGWFLRVNGNAVGTLWSFGGGNFITPEGGALPAANVWSHIAATYDGTWVYHYVNGVLRYRVLDGRALAPNNTGNLGIGTQDPGSGGEFFLGGLDEVAVYNKALTPAQISAHYAAGLAALTTVQASRSKFLTAASAGVAVATATLTSRRSLAAVSAGGSATVTAALTARRRLLGGAAGFGNVNVSLSRKRPLVGASAGVATTASAKFLTGLNAIAAGRATVTGTLTALRALAGTSAGVAAATALVSRVRLLTGLSEGTSTASAQPGKLVTISVVSAAGHATVSASLTRLRSLTGSSQGKALVAVQIGRRRTIPAVSANGMATVTVALTRKRGLVVSTIGRASTSGNLSVRVALSLVYWRWDGLQFVTTPVPGVQEVTWLTDVDAFDFGQVVK